MASLTKTLFPPLCVIRYIYIFSFSSSSSWLRHHRSSPTRPCPHGRYGKIVFLQHNAHQHNGPKSPNSSRCQSYRRRCRRSVRRDRCTRVRRERRAAAASLTARGDLLQHPATIITTIIGNLWIVYIYIYIYFISGSYYYRTYIIICIGICALYVLYCVLCACIPICT